MPLKWLAATLFCGLLSASDKAVDPGRAENESVNIAATAHLDPGEFQQLVGADIGTYFTIVQVTLTPRKGKIRVDRDDFLLRTYRDGERTKPLAASEIAGRPDMILHEEHVGPSEATGRTGPIWQAGPVGGGAGAAHPKVMTATVNKDDDSSKSDESKTSKGKRIKESPLTVALKKSMLPDGETDHPVSGVLIFNLEKQKLKDLELDYTTPEGVLKVRFK